jgi:hypothetical protein
VQEIMSKLYSIPTSGYSRSFAQSEVQTEIYAGRPFIMRWYWRYGGAHALVGHGIVGNMVYWFDPWPWSPQFNVSPYSQVVRDYDGINPSYDHTWTETIKPNVTPRPPVPDIKANGIDGTLHVSSTTPVNVTASLNAGGFTNTQADLWIAAYYNGVLYFQNSAGLWTTQAVPIAQGAIFSFSPVSVFYSTLPPGTTITFYFAIDLTMNGIFDNPYYYDYVTVIAY